MTRLPVSACLALATLLSACPPDELQEVLPPGFRVDTVNQQSAREIDVLWVVDNSGSMAPRQQLLADNFNSFINEFTRSSVDYRIAVTDTDISKGLQRETFRGSTPVIAPSTRNLLQVFASNVKVGTAGSPFEAGLEAARISIEQERARNKPLVDACAAMFGGNPDAQRTCEQDRGVRFLRSRAFLYIIFISDEEDRSEKPVRYYWRWFETVKGIGNDGMVSTAAIMGDVPTNGCNATPGFRYKELSDLTGGDVGSICDSSFADTLRKLAVNAVGLRRRFALQEKPELSSLEVRVTYPCQGTEQVALAGCASVDRSECDKGSDPERNRIRCEVKNDPKTGWSYEESTNTVFFNGDSTPFPLAKVELQYCPASERLRCGIQEGM